MHVLVAIVPRFQVDEAGARVGSAAFGHDLVPRQRRYRRDLRDLRAYLLQVLRNFVGGLQRRTRRRLDDGVDGALVLAGDETRRQHFIGYIDAHAERTQ